MGNPENVLRALAMRVEETGEHYVYLHVDYEFIGNEGIYPAKLRLPQIPEEQRLGHSFGDMGYEECVASGGEGAYQDLLYRADSAEEASGLLELASQGRALFCRERPIVCEDKGIVERRKLLYWDIMALAAVDRYRAERRFREHDDTLRFFREMSEVRSHLRRASAFSS